MIKNKTAFTLVEILVVTTIIGLLVGAGAVSYTILSKNSRDARRKADLEQMRAALELYKSNIGSYPSTSNGWWGECSTYGTHPDTGATGYIPNLAPTYISRLPSDPKEGQTISHPNCNVAGSCYLYRSNGTDYKLLAHCTVENPVSANDPYYDSVRTNVSGSWAIQVSSSQNSAGW